MMGATNIKEFVAEIEATGKKLPADLVRIAQRRAGLRMFEVAIKVSPVDTGRFRGNWQASVGAPATGELKTADPRGTDTTRRLGAAIATLPDFAVVYLTNNLPYAEAIDVGGYIPPNPKSDPESLKKRRASRNARVRRRAKLVGGHEGAPLVRGGFLIQRPGGITPLVIQAGLEALRKVRG